MIKGMVTKYVGTLIAVLLFISTDVWSASLERDFVELLSTGTDAYSEGDYETAYREWEPLAKQGNAPAQYFLGEMFKRGRGGWILRSSATLEVFEEGLGGRFVTEAFSGC